MQYFGPRYRKKFTLSTYLSNDISVYLSCIYFPNLKKPNIL